MSKMASYEPFGHLKPKLWAKEGPGVKLAVWLPTTKSRESTRSRCALGECDMSLKRSRRGLQDWFRPCSDLRSGRGVMAVQSPGSPTGTHSGQLRDSISGVPRKCDIWMRVPRRVTEYTIGSMVVASPEPGPWCVLWVRVSPWLVPTPNACRMTFNQLVLVWMQVRDQIAWSLPSLILELPTWPLYPF
jgi:hypothetical protein